MIEGSYASLVDSIRGKTPVFVFVRFIWSGDSYLTVRGRGACTSFPDMPQIVCKTQPKLTSIEYCPEQCPKGCLNGYCDCATGQCLCNPGFAGPDCRTDLCAVAGCINGHCSAQYLGGEIPVSHKPCVCMEGWYGDRCDSSVPLPSIPEPAPLCFDGCYYFMDTDIAGGQIAAFQTTSPKSCCAACQENPACNAWVFAGACYLKTGTQRIPKVGIISGIRCTASFESSTIAPTTLASSTNHCDHQCRGQYPYGCNAGFPIGYCNAGGGCSYSPMNNRDWCCFKGCSLESTVTEIPTTSTLSLPSSCDGKCRGEYPFGCNPSFSVGYCNAGGGCSYSTMNDPNWCCFKGC